MGLRDAIMPLVPGLRRYARALVADPTGNPRAADDLVADTLKAALRSERLRQGAEVRLPLYAMLITLHRERWRSQGARASKPPETTPAADSAPLAYSRIEAALGMLPIELRELLLLVVIERMTYEEAAEILGLPLATVLARLTRARDELRVHFNGTVAPAEAQRPVSARAGAHLRLVK